MINYNVSIISECLKESVKSKKLIPFEKNIFKVHYFIEKMKKIDKV